MKRAQLLKDVMGNLENGFSHNDDKHIRIMIDRGLDMDRGDRSIISDFCNMCSSALNLESEYKCYLSDDRKRAKIATSAICDYSRKNIRIYCRQRALADILRSIAHEMYHLRQNELGLVPKKMKQHHLSPVEWQANIAAGSLLSYFAQKVGRDKIYR